MRISESKIDEIRSSADIVDIISGYVQLKKRGKNYIGVCPFHTEKTPSFTVSSEKQIFHCFGCHAGGNVFKFLMDYKSISFVESVQEVAEQIGITLEYEKEYKPEEQSEQELLYEINNFAARYFSNNLLKSEDGGTARNYFKNRNIKPEIQKTFGLGYAFPEWEHFLNYAKENKIDLDKAKQLGLIDTRDNGTYYDKYRGRVIFPIFSTNGRVIAFGGRILTKQENTAKYLNSPESIIYHKRKSLYGLYHSKEEIRKLDKAILVEGYMDLIALYQHGIKNVVASSGTALTEEQVKLLSRFTKNIIVLFDADAAGQKASMRSIETLLKEDFDVKLVALPEGEDPDSYVNKFGKTEFEERIKQAKNFLEYQTSQFEAMGWLEDPAKQADAIRVLVRSAALVNDELKRSLLLKSISRKFNLREKLLETEMNKVFAELQRLENKPERVSQKNYENMPEAAGSPQTLEKKENPFEKEIIMLLLEGNENITGYIFDNIQPEDLNNPFYKKLASVIYDFYMNDIISTSEIIEKLEDDELRKFVLKMTMDQESISKRWDEYAHSGKIDKQIAKHTADLVKRYKVMKIDEQISFNNKKINSNSSDKEIMDLMKLNKELQQERKAVLSHDETI